MKISSFDDFRNAYGDLKKEPVRMKTHDGNDIEFLIAGIGASARDRIQAIKFAMLDKDSIAKGEAKLKDSLSGFEGDSALTVSLGAVNEKNERFMDNTEALNFLKNNVIPSELDRIADNIKTISGLNESIKESEKN